MGKGARKKGKAGGGRTSMWVSGNPDVKKEAENKVGGSRKRGGRVGKDLGLATGGVARHRFDRPGRRMGGRVGSDKSPLSSANKGSTAGGETPKSQDSYGGLPPD